MSKERVEDISEELQKLFDELEVIAEANKSVTITEDGYICTFGTSVEHFSTKLTHFRRILSKFSKHLPSERRKRNVK